MKVNPKRASGNTSLRGAINEKCRDCIFDSRCGGGTWREQVAQCSSIRCPLWPVRPAPGSGPFSNPCRDPEAVPQEWVRLPVGLAFSPHPTGELAAPLATVCPDGQLP